MRRFTLGGFLAFLSLTAVLPEEAAPVLTTLATFNVANGANPSGSLIADAAGNLYGTTGSGGVVGAGTVFKIAAGSYALTTLASFEANTNGGNPSGTLSMDTAGNLYGTTAISGPGNFGTVFKVTAGIHTLTNLATFNDINGSFPESGVIADAAGNLYGTTKDGGANGLGDGTVFKVAAGTHALTTLATFSRTTNGKYPNGLTADRAGNLYGTTMQGGANGFGTVFQVAASTHALTTLASFNGTNGSSPLAGVLSDANGNLYGTTVSGGIMNSGTVFQVAAGTHTLTTLASFSDGANGRFSQSSLIADAVGNLYGTTVLGGAGNGGTVFKVAAGTHAITTLATFDNVNGVGPQGGLLADAAGNLYGSTGNGGSNNNGTVFKLTGTGFVPTLATVPTSKTPAADLVGVYKPTTDNLKLFSPGTNTFVSGGNVDLTKPIVVLTHGFQDTPARWTDNTSFALALQSKEPNVNILAWDWTKDANQHDLGYSAGRTAKEGLGLSLALSTLLGSNYTNYVHFIGHSLGTLVNSEAIPTLHANVAGAKIQDTLLDEASIANQFVPGSGSAPSSTYTVNPIPFEGAMRIDSYVSSFGTIHPETTNPAASNIILQRDPNNLPDPTSAIYWAKKFHTYPVSWYQSTIDAASGVGFAGAIENGAFNPGDPAFQPGGYWLQSTSPGNPLTLSQTTLTGAAHVLKTRNDAQLKILQGAQADPNIGYFAVSHDLSVAFANVDISQLIGAVQVQNKALVALVNGQKGSLDIWTPQITLLKQPGTGTAVAMAVRQVMASSAISAASVAPTSSSYAWLPVFIPSDAHYLALDFTFHNLSGNDLLSVGFNDSPLFQLESQFGIDGLAQNTGLLDISAWAGQNVELFLGLVATDDINAGGTITIGNISFGSVPEPACLSLIAATLLVASRRAKARAFKSVGFGIAGRF